MLKKSVLLYFLIGAFSAALGTLLFYFGIFAGVERFFQDRLFLGRTPDDRIVILAIDDAALAHFGQWPWPRATFAKIIRDLNKLNPTAIGIDVNFPEPSRLGATDDEALARALSESRTPVVLAQEASPLILAGSPRAEKTIAPIGQFASRATLGYTNVIADPDGVVRSFPSFVAGEESISVPHFALQLAKILRPGAEAPNQKVLRINYAGPPGTFPAASLALDTDDPEKYRALAEGKVIIIGATAQSLQDQKPVPTGRGREMAGAEIHANILDTILGNHYLASLGRLWALDIVILLALIPPFFFLVIQQRYRSLLYIPLIISVLGLFVFFGAVLVQYENGIVIPLVAPSLSWLMSLGGTLAYRSLAEEREKRRIRSTFSKYVSPEVLEVILKQENLMNRKGYKTEAVILFTDLEGFTKLSESLPPERVIELLNIYFETMGPIVKKCRGVLDKYIGDALMAFWCEPFAGGKLYDRAVYAAFEMIRVLPEANKALEARGLPKINMRIGISSGEVIVGDIGSRDRLNFTVIGDPVNAAARLEALNKEYHSQILISEMTYNQLKESYPLEKLGVATVRGKSESFAVFGYRG
ncbi:MAG: adenylate/guanylate cyclase domain-containing protein [Candidatus Sungbacteria bacterium]|nr:adenylate/guanylate cyclase domain-containing protein [Candidatus Sungbacteria bacterium]